MSYFKPFPLKKYDIEKNKNTKSVTDLTKRVGVRGNMNNLIHSYNKISVPSESRPEMVSYQQYGHVNNYWILLILNNIIDPYYDWVISSSVLDETIDRMYPNKNLLLYSDHFQTSTIVLDGTTYTKNTYNTVPDPTFFISGETITGSVSSATGQVVKFDSTIKQIIYKQISGTHTGTFVKDDIITGTDSTAKGKVESATTEREGVHHYESSAPEEAGFVVDRGYVSVYGTTSYYSKEVTNAEYMDNENENNRNISLLKDSFISTFEKEFNRKIGG